MKKVRFDSEKYAIHKYSELIAPKKMFHSCSNWWF